MKKLNRTLTRVSSLCFIFATPLVCMGGLLNTYVFWTPGAILLAAGLGLMLYVDRCPYCGTMFRGLRWNEPNAGYCNKCGQLMEYDHD